MLPLCPLVTALVAVVLLATEPATPAPLAVSPPPATPEAPFTVVVVVAAALLAASPSRSRRLGAIAFHTEPQANGHDGGGDGNGRQKTHTSRRLCMCQNVVERIHAHARTAAAKQTVCTRARQTIAERTRKINSTHVHIHTVAYARTLKHAAASFTSSNNKKQRGSNTTS